MPPQPPTASEDDTGASQFLRYKVTNKMISFLVRWKMYPALPQSRECLLGLQQPGEAPQKVHAMDHA